MIREGLRQPQTAQTEVEFFERNASLERDLNSLLDIARDVDNMAKCGKRTRGFEKEEQSA